MALHSTEMMKNVIAQAEAAFVFLITVADWENSAVQLWD